jgi:lysophospholipase L1-like esterase
MLDCLILGDSIAVGTHQFKPECAVYAKGGWNSRQWNKKFIDKDDINIYAKTVIISLGTNDHKGIHTYAELKKMRMEVRARQVFWIMPAIKPDIQQVVQQLAEEHGDTILPIKNLQKDGIHPSWAGYKKIVEETK